MLRPCGAAGPTDRSITAQHGTAMRRSTKPRQTQQSVQRHGYQNVPYQTNTHEGRMGTGWQEHGVRSVHPHRTRVDTTKSDEAEREHDIWDTKVGRVTLRKDG